MALPAGFVLDKPEKVKLPSGFVLDSQKDEAGLPSIAKREPREAPTYDPLGQVIGDISAPMDYEVQGKGKVGEPGALTTLTDLVKQFIAPGVKAPFALPQATETAIKGLARQSMEGTPEALMPSSVFQPGLDTEETLFGPETDAQKARRKLQAQRAVAAMPSIPGAATLNKIGENVQKDIQNSLSPEAKKALQESQITGNIFKGEVDFGKNPSAYGYALQAANVFGSMAPVIATAMVTKSPGIGGYVGGTMAADEAATKAAEYINKIPDAELLKKSPFYAEMIAGGASPKEARELTIKKAAESGAALQGLVATFGDVLTGKLVTGAFDKTIAKLGTNRIARAGAVGGASSLEESLQEVGEGLASDVALKNVISSKELGEDSAANLILGALGGAGPGVIKGALSEGEPKEPEREKYVKPEGGLAELMARQRGFLRPEGGPPAAPTTPSPVPPAPPAGPAEIIEAPGSESRDTQAMLEELINTVNINAPKEPEVEKPAETVFTAPADFAYSITQSPAYGNADPLSVDDAQFELDVLLENAKRGRLTPQRFAESEIGRRLDTSQVMAINDGIRNNPIATVEALIQKIVPAETPVIEAPAAEAPKAEPTLKEQYDKAAKLNFAAGDAFRNKIINQEQLDTIRADYERIKTEYQASIPKADLNPIQQEAIDIADKLEALGLKPFADGMRTSVEKNQVGEKNLEFYRTKLKQEQAKQSTLEEGVERPSEKWNWSEFYGDDTKGLEKLKLFNSKAPPAVKQTLQDLTDSIQAITDRLNDEGYTMRGAAELNVPNEIKDLRSQIMLRSAEGSLLINKFEALNKGFKRSKNTTNQQNLDTAIQEAKAGIAEAQKSLQRSVPEPEEVVNARASLAEANKRVETLQYKSGSLWSALMGKLDPEEVREIFGPNPSFGEKKLQVTKKSGKRGTYISEMADNGMLDPFLPIAMRRASGRFDAAEAAQYIKDAVANKDYLPDDAKEEIKQIYKAVEPLGDLIDEYLTIEEQNRELQIAFDEQREIDQAAEIIEPEGEDRAAEPSERQEREPLELTAQTENELKAKQDEIDRLAKENERLTKEAERKAKADEARADFTLTGSDREADVAAARGQKDIFAEDNTFNPVELGEEFPEIGAEAFAYLDTTNAEVRKAIGDLYKEGDIDGAIEVLENMPKNTAVVEKQETVAEIKKRLNTLMMQNMKSLDENPALEKEIDELTQKLRDASKKPKKAKEEPKVEEPAEELVEAEEPSYEVETPEGNTLTYPAAYGLVNTGYTVLALNDPRTYTDKGGTQHRTFEKNGARIAVSPNQVLFEWKGRVQYGMGNPNELTLEMLAVDPKDRGKGKGTQVLKDLTKVADQYGITLYGEPVPIVNLKQNDVGLDFDQLVNLYKKFDFKFQETDNGVSERVIVRQPEAEVLPAAKPQIAGQVGFEPYTIEGDFTEVAEEQQRLMLEDQTENLSDDQVSTLEKHYGAKIDSDEFFTKLREDVSNFIVKGATAVHGKIRAIIRQLANGVLAVGIAFNPQYMSQPLNVFMPIDNVRTEEVLATVPDAATDKMSEPAKRAFAVIYPALQEQMMAKDKLFIMADKPSGRIFIFNPDGSLLLDKKSLFGLAKGDIYVGDNEKPQNRITPAGLFDLKLVDAQKGESEKRTAGDYDTGTVLAINDPEGTITIMHSVWLKEKDAAQRAAALRNDSPADSRYSFGCINVDAPTYSYLVNNHYKQMDGAALFVVPEAGVDVMSFITGKGSMSEDLARIKVKPVTKEVRTPQKQVTPTTAQTKVPGREQIFYSIEPQTKTQAFKKWFGDSKVVDKDGNPMVVYHGTIVRPDTGDVKGMGDILAFDRMFTTQFRRPSIDNVGSFFSTNPSEGGAQMYSGTGEGAAIYPVYLSIKNPYTTTFETMLRRARMLENGVDDGRKIGAKEVEALRKFLKESGKDGIHIKADPKSAEFKDQDVWIALEPEQIKSATGNRGTFDESGNINMSIEGKKLPPGRSPELAAAARQLKEGKITAAEFDKLVNQYRPITPYEKPLKPATTAQMVDALSSEKKDKVNPNIPEGTRVGLRLDIPAFNRKGVYVVTIHEKGTPSGPGKAIGYDSVAVINNVNFGTGNQRKGLNIATGEAKDALQTMEGEFVKTDPAQAYVDAVMAMDDPEWVQIGVDPTRHSYFYDRNTTQPVVAAEQVIQIGNMVLAKNVTYGKKEDFLYNLEDDLIKLVNDTADSIDEANKKRSPSFKRKAKVLTNQRNEGKLTDEEYLERMNAAIAEDEESRLGVDRKDRVRGADFIREKLLNAKRNGFLSDEAVDLAEWFIGQNPALVDDLGISIKAKGPEGAGGFYNPLARIITLIKERGSDLTTTHEILHHLERMMPAKIQAAIRKAWLTQLMKANKAAKDPAQKLYFMALLDAHIGNNNHTRLEIPKGSEGIYKAIVEQMKFANELTGGRGADPKSSALARELLLYSPTVPSELYEYFDPSEFWAVNGSDIVQARFDAVKGGVLARLKNWLREFAEKVKSLFGMKSDASIIRALDSLAKSDGKFVTDEMLGTGDYQSVERRNYQGGEAPEPDMEIPEMSFMDDTIYKFGDKLIDTKRLIESIKSTGRKLNEQFDAYMKEENYHGRLAKRTNDFLDDEMRPILQEMQEKGVSLDELEKFLLNRHAKEANAYIAKINPTGFPEAGSSVSDADADAYMAALTPEKRKDLMALAAKVDKIVKETQRVLVANGLETQETIDEWNATYKNYVPLMRDNLDFVHTGRGVMGGFATRGSASKRRVGSDKPVIDIFANIAMQRERALRRSEQARVGRALYGMAIKHPNPGFWLAINPDAIKDKDKLEAELISLGLKPEDAQSIIQEPRQPMFDKKTGQVKYQVNPLLRNSPNVFPVRINGEDRFIFFNPNDPRALRMVESMKNLDTERLGDVIGVVGMVTRWFASVNTQYNIVFGGVNFLRDLGAASLNLSTTEIAGKEKQVRANVLPALRAIYRDLRGKGATTEAMEEMQNWFERFQLAGGQTGYQNQFAETKRKGNVVEQELKRLNRGNVKKAVDSVFDWLSDYNDAIENAVRLSAFKVAVESGLSEDKAASIAKNLTVNFNRKGARTGLISSLYAFFNAAVQGSARMIQTLRGPMGKKIIFGGMFLGAMQAVILALSGFDDDEPTEFVKDKNLIIPIPFTDKKYLSVPMPLGFNMFPGFGRLAMETLLIETGMIKSRKGPGDKLMSAVSLVFDAFNPLGGAGNPLLMAMPTILDPFAAIYSNRDAFGRPIYREDKGTAPTPGYERSRENASLFSKKLAEAINWATSPAGTQHTKGFFSPTADQIDYFIGQITGGVGREIMKVGEFAKSKAVTQEEMPAYKLPIVGRFYGEADSPAATRSRFYENVTAMAKHENEIKGLRKDRTSPAEYIKANPEARFWQRANNVENQIVKLNKEKKALIERDAPREAVKRKEDEILNKMKQFNDQIRRAQ